MSVPNQFKVTLNRHKVNMKEKGPSWTAYYDYTLQDAFSHLNKSGLAVYFYLSMQIPHYYDRQVNYDNKRARAFEFSPEAVSKAMGISPDSVKNGWKELIKFGYLKEISKNKYYFTDDINEEKIYEITKKIENDEILAIDEIYPKENKQVPKYDWE